MGSNINLRLLSNGQSDLALLFFCVFSTIQSIREEIEPTDYQDNDNYRRGKEASIAFRRGIREMAQRRWEEMSARIMIAQQSDRVYQKAILRGFARLRIQRRIKVKDQTEKRPT